MTTQEENKEQKLTYKELHKFIIYLKNKMLKRRVENTATETTAIAYYNALAEIDSYFHRKLINQEKEK